MGKKGKNVQIDPLNSGILILNVCLYLCKYDTSVLAKLRKYHSLSTPCLHILFRAVFVHVGVVCITMVPFCCVYIQDVYDLM